jgi:general secretion pathway protein L
MAFTDALRLRRLVPAVGGVSIDDLLERWREALTACLPERLGRALAPRDPRVTLIPHGEKATLCHGRGSEREILGEIGTAAPENVLRALLATTKRGSRRSVIELPREAVMARVVSFPAQVRKNLAQVVAYEIDRLTPFHPDQVCFDFRPLDTPSKGSQLAVELALCRRDLIKTWLERLRSAGAPAEQIVWEGAWPRANLLPAAERPPSRRRRVSPSKLLLLLVLSLTAAALVTPLWQKNRVLAELEQRVSELKTQADEVYQLREAIERARQGSIAVLESKSRQPRMIDLLLSLTDRLPDDTWVQNLDYRDGEVQIRGESSQAAALIGVLEQAPGFEDVAFRSPVVQVAATGLERFHIAFRYSRVEQSP